MQLRTVRSHIGFAVLYLMLAVGVTWPIGGRLGTAVPGSEGDVWVHLWTFRWVRDQLLDFQSPFFTELMYYPDGVSLTTHNFAWFHIMLWMPLQAFVGEEAAYSLIFLAGFAFTAWATYLFAYSLLPNRDLVLSGQGTVTGRNFAAFLAGCVAGFWPYTLSHHNHPNLIFIGFIPLSLWLLKRFFEDPTRSRAIHLGIGLGMVGIVRWQVAVFSIPLFLVCALILLGSRWIFRTVPMEQERSWPERLVALGLGLGIAALLVLLPLSPLLLNSVETSNVTTGESILGSTDLMAYVIPHFYHPLWGDLFKPLTEPFLVNKVFTPYLGLTAVCLAGLALFTRPRRNWFWLLIALIYLVLALGPVLTINGIQTGITLPYSWIDGTLLDAIIRRPDRLNIFISIPMAVMVAHGAQHLLSRLSGWINNKRVETILLPVGGLCLTGLILLEFWNQYPMFEIRTPEWHQTLAEDPDAYALLELPMHARVYDELYMQFQATHSKAMVGGHVSRLPENALAFIQSISFLNARETIGPNRQSFSITEDLFKLSDANIRYIVLHKSLLTDEQLEEWKRFLIIQPMFEDGDTVVYSTELPFDDSTTAIFEFDPIQPLGLLDYDIAIPAPTQAGLIQTGFVWLSDEALAEPIETCLVLYTKENPSVQESCETLSYFEEEWPAYALHHTNHRLSISPYLDPDEYHLGLKLNPSGAFLSLGSVDINIIERQFQVSREPTSPSDLTWEDQIKLRGYDIEGKALTLYWESLDRVEQDLVRFVHLIDPNSGELIGQ
ncbi:MAG: hypothetical protein AAF633_25495, partial [Chloroflexota bacterium]